MYSAAVSKSIKQMRENSIDKTKKHTYMYLFHSNYL